jgi:hypothetical protein
MLNQSIKSRINILCHNLIFHLQINIRILLIEIYLLSKLRLRFISNESSSFKWSIDINLKTMKFEIMVALFIWTTINQINHTAIPPIVVPVKINPSTESVPKQHSFK